MNGEHPKSDVPTSNPITIMRYGIKWNGPREPIATPMEDGYWTPWHIANAEIERLQKDRNECLEAFHILFRIFPEPK